MRSEISSTSSSLWLMKMTALPRARNSRSALNSSRASAGVSTAVGSSRISTRAWRASTRRISTRCCSPADRSLTRASGRTARLKRSASAAVRASSCAAEARSRRLAPAEMDVFRDREGLHQLEMLVHHADAGGDRLHRRREGRRVAVDDDLTGIRLIDAGEDVHEGRFAGAVLAQQRMDFAGANFEIDVRIGDDAGKMLGDAAQQHDRRRSRAARPASPALGLELSMTDAGDSRPRASYLSGPNTPSTDQSQL